MRRKDRQTDRESALAVVDGSAFATLALSDGNAPYAVALSIARIGENLYFHCAKSGKKIDLLRQNPRVCVSFVGEVIPSEREFATNYCSAVVYGTAEEVTDVSEKIAVLRAIARRYTPQAEGVDDEIARDLQHVSVWKIPMEEITGKRRTGI